MTRERGRLLEAGFAPVVAATVHPSSILRARGSEERRERFALFVEDLSVVVRAVDGGGNGTGRGGGG